MTDERIKELKEFFEVKFKTIEEQGKRHETALNKLSDILRDDYVPRKEIQSIKTTGTVIVLGISALLTWIGFK